MKEKIEERIKQLEAERQNFFIQAQGMLTAYEARVQELKLLIEEKKEENGEDNPQ